LPELLKLGNDRLKSPHEIAAIIYDCELLSFLRASQILELSRNEKMTLECWSHAPAFGRRSHASAKPHVGTYVNKGASMAYAIQKKNHS